MFDKDSDYFITRRKKRGKIAEIPCFLCLLAVGRQFFTRFCSSVGGMIVNGTRLQRLVFYRLHVFPCCQAKWQKKELTKRKS